MHDVTKEAVMTSEWQRFKKELLENPETRAEYDRRKPAYELASKLVELRKTLELSQRDLARAAGMTQPEIARIELGKVSPTWDTLAKILAGVGGELEMKVRGPGGKFVRV